MTTKGTQETQGHTLVPWKVDYDGASRSKNAMARRIA